MLGFSASVDSLCAGLDVYSLMELLSTYCPRTWLKGSENRSHLSAPEALGLVENADEETAVQ